MLDGLNTAFSTYQMAYTKENVTNAIENGYQQLNDEEVNKCIGCLLLKRRYGGRVQAKCCCSKCRCADDLACSGGVHTSQ